MKPGTTHFGQLKLFNDLHIQVTFVKQSESIATSEKSIRFLKTILGHIFRKKTLQQ